MAELHELLLRSARELAKRRTHLEEELRELRSNLEAELTALQTESKTELEQRQAIERKLQDGECKAKDLQVEIQHLEESMQELKDSLKNIVQSNEDLKQECRQLEPSIERYRAREEQLYREYNTRENELRRSFDQWTAPWQSAFGPLASTLPEATPAPEPHNPNQAANHPHMPPAAQDDGDETIYLGHSDFLDYNDDPQPRRSDRTTKTSRPANESDRAASNQRRKRGAAETNNSGPTGDSVTQKRQRRGSQQRTIDFEEVYQNGNAEEKHFIVEWPKETGKWYILLCEEHHKHFHRHPLLGAAKHLNGRQHGNLNKDYSNAVKKLGILVQNCTEEKAKLNNQVLRDFLLTHQYQDDSHQVTQGENARESHAGSAHLQDDTNCQSSTSAAQAAHQDRHEEPKGKHENPKAKKSRDYSGILNPDVGKVYRAHHKGKVYTCLILPLGSFQSTGVEGDFYDSYLAHEIPVCYDTTGKSGGAIIGWAAEYQDRRRSARGRRFPTLFFDHVEVPDEGHVKISDDRKALIWVLASKLSSFDLDDPECRKAKGYEGARKFCKRMGLAGSRAPAESPGHDSNQSDEHYSGRATSNDPQPAEKEQDVTAVLPKPPSPASPAAVPNNNRHSQYSSPASGGPAMSAARFVPVSASKLSDRKKLSRTVPSTGPQIPPTHQDQESVHSLSDDVAMEIIVRAESSESRSDERTSRSGTGKSRLTDLEDETLDRSDSSLSGELLRQQPSTTANSTPANRSSRLRTVNTQPITELRRRMPRILASHHSGVHGSEMSQQPRIDSVSTSASITTPVPADVFAAATSTVPRKPAAQRPPVRPLGTPVVGPLSQQSSPLARGKLR